MFRTALTTTLVVIVGELRFLIRIFIIAALIVLTVGMLAGCSGEKAPPTAHGDWKVLAPGLWDIDPARVTVPPMPGE